LFTGYGYQCRIVEYGIGLGDKADPKEAETNVNYDMAASLEWAYGEIKKIQTAARSGKPITKPRWPMIVMRTPKGWSGPKSMNGNAIEGSWRAHQGMFDHPPLHNRLTRRLQFPFLEPRARSKSSRSSSNGLNLTILRSCLIPISILPMLRPMSQETRQMASSIIRL
jgi:hypothetical protein